MACSLARIHIPVQPNPDEHHVIPQAWQRFRGGIFDPRTVTVCPNHHRLVHEAIVAMMRCVITEEPAEAYRAAFGSYRTTQVRQTAYLALTRWVEADGSLVALRRGRLWGEQ